MPTLSKKFQHVEVAHLYEHIVTIQLRRELFTRGFLADVDFWLDCETLFDGSILVHFSGTHPVVGVIKATLENIDDCIITGSADITLAVAHVSAEYKAELQFQQRELLEALQTVARATWTSSRLNSDIASGKREVYGDRLIKIVKTPANYRNIAIDFYLNDGAYLTYPATIFVFDQLAHVYLSSLFSACLDKGMAVYWRRLEKRRNKHHVRQTLVLTVGNGLSPSEIEKTLTALDSVLETDAFTRKFYDYLGRVAAHAVQLKNDYDVVMDEDTVNLALKEGKIGDLTGEMGVEFRELA